MRDIMLERSGNVKNYFDLANLRFYGALRQADRPLEINRKPFYPKPPKPITKGPRNVTIAAGFYCTDGVVIATDLEISEATIKRSAGKSSLHTWNDKAVAVAGAGIYDLLVYACERVMGVAKDVCDPNASLTFDAARRSLRRCVADIYGQHIHPFYESHERGGVLELLIALTLGSIHAPVLFKSSRSVLTVVSAPYEFAGIGREFAYYLMKNQKDFYTTCDFRLYESINYGLGWPASAELIPFVRSLICTIAENVQGCGQGVSIIKVSRDGESSYVQD